MSTAALENQLPVLPPVRDWKYCSWCGTPCPGVDADGFCLLADRAEIDARIHWVRTGERISVAPRPPSAPPGVTVPAPSITAASPELPTEAPEVVSVPAVRLPRGHLLRNPPEVTYVAGRDEWWRWTVLLNGVPQRLVAAAGPGWVRVFTTSQNGYLPAADRLDDLASRLFFGQVVLARKRGSGTCPVLELAERIGGWQAEAVRQGVGRMLPAQLADGSGWMVLEVTDVYPTLRTARAVVVLAQCSEQEAREICAEAA